MTVDAADETPTDAAPRSVLYVPGSQRRALDKTATLDADGFIFDLEDAVAPEAKAQARAQVAAYLRTTPARRQVRVVRVNARDSEWWREDMETICHAGPDALLAPKICTAQDIRATTETMRHFGAPERMRLWIMIETPRALLEIGALAAAAQEQGARLAAFVVGANDLAKHTRARQTADRAPMAAWLSMTVAAARAYGLDVFDGVFADLADCDGFRRECAQGRDFGMDGKTLIHPSQIDACNEAFSPSPADLASARAILAAFALPENAGRGAIRVGGRMVEKLHAESARRTLAAARGGAERDLRDKGDAGS